MTCAWRAPLRLPQSRSVLRRPQSRSAWHCLVPVQHRPTEYWSASPPPPSPLRLFGVVPASAPLPLGKLPPHGIGGSGWYRVRQYLAKLSLAVGHRCLPCRTSSDVSALPSDSWAPARRRRPAQLGPSPAPCPSRCRRAMHAPPPKPSCRGGQLSSQPPSRRGRCWRGDGRGMPPRWRLSAARPATGARPGLWRLL